MSDKGKKSSSADETAVQFWLGQMHSSEKREKDWRERAVKVVSLYEGAKREQSPFNILYSNTDTLMPALYSNTPRAQVVRRFKDKDPLAMAACTALTRVIDYALDTNDENYPEFDELANQAILEALVPGRGVVRWKYDATITEGSATGRPSYSGEVTKAGLDEGTTDERDASMPSEGDNIQPEVPTGEVEGEKVCGEFVPYDRFLMGYARKWKDVPWIAFIHYMTRDEAAENFGEAIAKEMTFTATETEDGDSEKTNDQKDDRELAQVYEIWDKVKRKVRFVSPSSKEKVLKEVDDPLQLSGFYPMDAPLSFHRKISTLVPTAPYDLYAEQAEELNIVTRRITAIVGMLRVRGMYDQTVEGLDKVLKADDGELIPAQNVASLQQGQKLSDALWLMPLNELVAALQQLLLQRTNIKQVIYEITGISDILRGSTQASETATAQSIKNQWGTLRLKKMQKMVAKWVRNNLRIVAEIAGKRFSVETFQKVTGLPYVTQAKMDEAKMAMGQLQQQAQQQMLAAQQQAVMAQQTGQQAPPPQPPAPPPQELLDTLATPVWEAVVDLLRNLEGRSFRVDIETNSTIADDMAEDQKNIGELLNALSQYLNGVTPLIQAGAMPFTAAKTMMLAIVRRMQFGPDLERELEQMQEPKPPAPPEPTPPPPEDPNIKLKQAADAQRIQMQMAKDKQDMEAQQQEHALKLAELRMKGEHLQLQHRLKMETAQIKADALQRGAAPAGAGS